MTRNITASPLDGMIVHYRVFSTKRLGAFLLLDRMLVYHRVTELQAPGDKKRRDPGIEVVRDAVSKKTLYSSFKNMQSDTI